ncbi:MAG: shikimate dehydrogenase [Bacteroidota bacterium]|jgi:shikimate dehydrogenase
MRQFGIIGYPLSHSFSRPYFHNKFVKENIPNAEYHVFPIENINDINTIVSKPELLGLSVTIPHKQAVIPFLDELDDTALKIGAVNCVKISHTNSITHLKGFNTDCIGFEESLKPLLKPYHTQALILGTGGASKAVAYVLNKLNIDFLFVSRTKSADATITYDELNEESIAHNLLIVNTTPLGMYPNINNSPRLPYQYITEKHLLYDLIYNPEETEFLKQGKLHNAATYNGEKMLHLQAEASWKIWND